MKRLFPSISPFPWFTITFAIKKENCSTLLNKVSGFFASAIKSDILKSPTDGKTG